MKKVFYLLIFLFGSFNAFSQYSLDSGLVAYYPFNGNDSDNSISSNQPIHNSAILTADRFGNQNAAYYFNGNTSYIKIPNKPSLNFNNKMSICVWFKPMGYYQGLCYNNMLIAKAINDASWANQGNYSMRFADYVNGCNSLRDSTKEYLYGPDGGVCSNVKMQTNRWYFAVFTTDGVTCRTYINNKLSHIGSHPQGQTFTNQHDLLIGMFGDSMNYPYNFKGVMDDIRLYNRALDYDEVKLLYTTSPYPTINGNVYVDVNHNGVMDSTDFYKPNSRINGSNGSFAITNFQGNYEIESDTTGSFQTTIDSNYLYTATPSGYSYHFNGYDTTVAGDFILQNTTNSFDSVAIRMIPLFNAARPGFLYPVSVSYDNLGNTTLSGCNFTINYDSAKLEYQGSSNNAIVNNGTTLTLPLFDFAPGDHDGFMLNFKVKTTATLGDTLKQVVNIASTVSASDNFWTIIRGSYDPNEKDATPQLTTTEVAQGKYIDYIIRFENVGSDTAFKVVVVDQLNTWINAGSMQITSLSHPCNIKINDKTVTFTFNNIGLPYTSIDKIGSHGYIAFRVKPLATVAAGTNIPNSASIYFDYNLPIITNTTITKIVAPIIVPLKITKYEVALVSSNNNQLVKNTWNTSNEVNVSHFNIERSIDGINFEKIGSQKANNKATNEYSFINELTRNEKREILYYRIVSIDNDGKKTYSNTKIVNFKPQISGITIYPNPAINEINISRTNASNEWVNIIDINGKILKSIRLQSTVQKISVVDLPKGVYVLSFSNKESHTFIKE